VASYLEPIALSPRNAASFLGVSKRTMARLIADGKVLARKIGARTLVDVASVKALYATLPAKGDTGPLVFEHPLTGRKHGRKRSRARVSASGQRDGATASPAENS
jgi:excisionase family DNA binding protein